MLTREEKYGVPVRQATKLKGISLSVNLTYERVGKKLYRKTMNCPKL